MFTAVIVTNREGSEMRDPDTGELDLLCPVGDARGIVLTPEFAGFRADALLVFFACRFHIFHSEGTSGVLAGCPPPWFLVDTLLFCLLEITTVLVAIGFCLVRFPGSSCWLTHLDTGIDALGVDFAVQQYCTRSDGHRQKYRENAWGYGSHAFSNASVDQHSI